MECNMSDPRDTYIRQVVGGKSFIDIGGLSTVVKERVSIAAQAGASKVALMDVESPACPWWDELRQRLLEKQVLECNFISGDVLSADLECWDVVHSSGVLYHLPNPIEYIRKLRKITKEFCILTSTTIATEISTQSGSISLPASSVIFVPALVGNERMIVKEWFEPGGRGDVTENAAEFGGWNNLENYYPNWFIPTVSAFTEMARCGGFDVVEGAPVEPHDYSYCLLLRPR
jgi:hypothetical protein